jgi:hypothetical protein
MRVYNLIFLSGLSLALLVACDNTDNGTEAESAFIDEQKEGIYDSSGSGATHYLKEVERADPTWAGISYSSRFASNLDLEYIAELTDPDDLTFIIDEMIEGSNREPGIVAMSAPLYGLEIEYADGSTEAFHLWISPDGTRGTVMDVAETHYIYTFSPEVSEQFLSFIPDEDIVDSPVQADWIDDNAFGMTEVIVPYSGQTVDQMIMYSDYIVKGSYVSEEPADVPESWGDESIAYYSFKVNEILKGELDSEEITIGYPRYFVHLVWDPETGEEIGMIPMVDPTRPQPAPEEEIIIFFNEGFEPGEYLYFSDESIVFVQSDDTLEGASRYYDETFDSTHTVERFEVNNDWEVEITLVIENEDLPLDDPYAGMTLDELKTMIP